MLGLVVGSPSDAPTPPGRYVTVTTAGEPFQAFVPVPLPPEPPLVWSAALRRRFDAALVALGRLDAVTALLPNAALLLYSFVRKEAVLSLQIEGTQSSLADLLLYEIDEQPGVPVDDAREVNRCVAALERGLKKLRGGLPLCTQLLCEMHKVLLTHPGGRGKTPGEVRRSQVWIGGTRPGNAVFVPPPADVVPDALAGLERFLNDQPEPVPPLIKAALVHVQFETIHPFLDGNGRVGRLLITLFLVEREILPAPLLYLSAFFEATRDQYYDRLLGVTERGEWEAWLEYFLTGVARQAEDAVSRAQRIDALLTSWRVKVARIASKPVADLIDLLAENPFCTTTGIAKRLGIAFTTAQRAIDRLDSAGVVIQVSAAKRNRVYCAQAILDLLEEPA
jgi:Fic family protein